MCICSELSMQRVSLKLLPEIPNSNVTPCFSSLCEKARALIPSSPAIVADAPGHLARWCCGTTKTCLAYEGLKRFSKTLWKEGQKKKGGGDDKDRLKRSFWNVPPNNFFPWKKLPSSLSGNRSFCAAKCISDANYRHTQRDIHSYELSQAPRSALSTFSDSQPQFLTALSALLHIRHKPVRNWPAFLSYVAWNPCK